MEKTPLSNIFKGDKTVWMIFFFLCLISIIEVYSASSSLSYKGGDYWSPIIAHTGKIVLGFVALVIVMNVECRYFKSATIVVLPFSIASLLWVLVAGQTINGANRWDTLMGIAYQPSEIAKGALVLVTAQILSAMQTDNGADRKAFRYVLMMAACIIIPIGVENLSTAVLLALTIVAMMFLGRVPMDQIGKLAGVVVASGALVVSLVMLVGHDTADDNPDGRQAQTEQMANSGEEKESGVFAFLFHRADTWKSRIDNFINAEKVPPQQFDLRGKDAQKGHASIAIASSNVIGKGLGKSTECDGLPQSYSDFIYAIIIEETGIVGAGVVALLYIVLLFRAGIIAKRCENAFPAYLVMGLAIMLVSQALFNMMVAVGLAPVTGQPLPLISRGGTSTIINCVYIGMMLSVSRSAKKKGEPATKVRGKKA